MTWYFSGREMSNTQSWGLWSSNSLIKLQNDKYVLEKCVGAVGSRGKTEPMSKSGNERSLP